MFFERLKGVVKFCPSQFFWAGHAILAHAMFYMPPTIWVMHGVTSHIGKTDYSKDLNQ